MGANTLLELSAYVGIPILAFCVLVFLISSVAHRSVTSEDFGAPLSTQIPVGTKDITVLLRIRRTHRFTWLLGRPKFILYFKADVSQEDLALIKKYKLHKAHLYTSEEFKAKQEEAFAPIDFTTLWRAVKGLFGKLFSFLDLLFLLKIKIGTLVRGKRVEKGELGDLLAFVNAGGSLQHFAGAIMQH